SDQFMPIFRHHKVILGEFETGEYIDAPWNDFRDLPRSKRVPRDRLLRKRRSERDRMVKVRIATATEIVLRFGFVAVVTCEFGEMVVHLTQPSGMRRFVNVFDAPRELRARGRSLPKKPRNLRVDDAGDPVHDKNFALR